MSEIHRKLQPVRARQQRFWLIQCAGYGLFAGAAIALILGGLQIWWKQTPSAAGLVGLIIAGPVLGSLAAMLRQRGFRDAATAVDQHYGLKDRATTALAFVETANSRAVHQLQVSDAERHLSQIDAQAVSPWTLPKPLAWGAMMTVGALAMLLAVSLRSAPLAAAPVVNDVVLAQAHRAAEQIEVLRKHNEEEPNTEIEQLIQELALKVEELQEPGIDPKEALAKLSEMQTALQEQQQQLEKASAEAALQAIGDALANAEPLSAAGSALTAGNYAKASEELEKLDEVPQLDRQAQKTITEKLDQAKQQMDAAKLRKLSEATENLSQGLSSGNGPKFSDGAKGLAGEAKKQGRRKKLSDLLRKQCQCLGECKSECESECQSESKAKGGNNWGRGKSGNEPGDKTSLLDSSRKLQLSGQEGDEGDVETESTTSPEGREQAKRGYRERYDQSQKLNESVLDSEPIPLGHRQTIRKYFELIRPQQSEVDQIKDVTEPKSAE